MPSVELIFHRLGSLPLVASSMRIAKTRFEKVTQGARLILLRNAVFEDEDRAERLL